MINIREFLKYLTPITVLGLAFLFIKYVYLNSFFRRLSIPYTIMTVPQDFQLNEIMGIFSIILYLVLIIVFFELSKPEMRISSKIMSKKRWDKVEAILQVFMSYIIIIVIVSKIIDYSIALLLILISLTSISLNIITKENENKHIKPFSVDVRNASIDSGHSKSAILDLDTGMVIFCIGLLTFPAIMTASYLGNVHAEEFLAGTSHNCFELLLEDVQIEPPLPRTPLILITQQNGYFFLVEKNISRPLDPKTYIISSDYIKKAQLIHTSKSTFLGVQIPQWL